MRWLILILFYSSSLNAQVINDDIENAINLGFQQAVTSSTAKCTVQSSCVNYALTKTCMKYHNDQWFTFNTSDRSDYYINIFNQECRDLFGVQLLVLEGVPCEPVTYELITCVSLGTNDDIYVPVANLKRNTTYLVNIDGYLNDFCSFSLELDTIPKGLPSTINMEVESELRQEQNVITMSWEMSEDSVGLLRRFEVWKRNDKDFKFSFHQDVPISRNTYGLPDTRYIFKDTLFNNTLVHYNLVAVDANGKRYLFDTRKTRGFAPKEVDHIILNLNYAQNTPLTIQISDKSNGWVFRKVKFSYNRDKHQILEYPTSYLISEGVQTVLVEIVNDRTGSVNKKEFHLKH